LDASGEFLDGGDQDGDELGQIDSLI
jgi:hypothetical protein